MNMSFNRSGLTYNCLEMLVSMLSGLKTTSRMLCELRLGGFHLAMRQTSSNVGIRSVHSCAVGIHVKWCDTSHVSWMIASYTTVAKLAQ